jgi:hypothetical protein
MGWRDLTDAPVWARTVTGKLVQIRKFPIVGAAGVLLFEDVDSGTLWTPCRFRDGLRSFGKLKLYKGERPADKVPLS